MNAELVERMRLVWESVLQAPVGDEDDFFEMGGHSLSAMRIIAATEELRQASLPLSLLFDHPVFSDFVAELAEFPA